MISLLLAAAALQSTPAKRPVDTGPADPREARYERCVDLAIRDTAAARTEASQWGATGGGWFARQCAGIAYTRDGQYPAAATEFTAAARAAELAHDARAANYWAQAGNAWLAAGEPAKARTALDTALVAGTLTGLSLGEAQLDHARALVVAGEIDAARRDLDLALTNATADPLAWLLSATLARRMGDLPRAKKDIAEALRRSADDASVQLEAGNIAATAHDEAGARTAWAEAARLSPNSDVGRHAVDALRQFDTPPPAGPVPATAPPPPSSLKSPPTSPQGR
jgi:tetratricopeptide (TPR) repeat protein